MDLDDVWQEKSIAALREANLARFETAAQLEAWIVTVAVHIGLAHVRAARAATRLRGSRSLREGRRASMEHDAMEQIPSGSSPVATDSAERSTALGDALERLASAEREVVILRSLLGVPWPTVAFVLARTEPAVRELHSRARNKLARR